MTGPSGKERGGGSARVGDESSEPFELLLTDTTAILGGVRQEQYRVVPDTAIGIANRRIRWIGSTDEAKARASGVAKVIDARGMLALPGLINSHNHLFQNLVKGLGDEVYLLPWVEIIILPTADEMSPEETYLGALLGCLEAIRSGTTSILDFMFGLPDIELHRAVMRAFRDSGIRGFLGRATRDLNPDSGYRDPWYLPLEEVFDQMRQLAREFPSGHSVPSVLPAPGTMRTMTVDGLLRVREYAESEGSQITIHMGEYTGERESAIDRWGIGAFAKGEEIGFLSPKVVAAHCVKVDRAEMEIIARTGAQVSFNPVSNAYLGNGFAPLVQMLETGIDVSLATDGGACGNTQDMIEALKFAAVIPKGREEDPRVINARDVLRLATAGGSKAVGLSSDLGALEVGRLADLFLFDPYRLKTVPVHDPISSVVYAGGQSNVDTVVIDGKVVLEDGKFPLVDEDALVREVQERAVSLAQRVGSFRLTKGRRFTPFGHDRRGAAAREQELARVPASARGPETAAADGANHRKSDAADAQVVREAPVGTDPSD